MSAVWFTVRAQLRVRWRAALGLAIVIGLTGGLVIAAIADGLRTDSSYERFRRAQNTAQLALASSAGVSGFSPPSLAGVARLPQVVDYSRFSLLFMYGVSSRGVHLSPGGSEDPNPVLGVAGGDGGFDRRLSRMKIIAGRVSAPTAQTEVVVSYLASMLYGIRSGDTIDFTFDGPQDGKATDFFPHGPSVNCRVVGVEAESTELPPGTSYPTVHFTPAFFQAYSSRLFTIPAVVLKLRRDSDVPTVLAGLRSSAIGSGSNVVPLEQFDETRNARTIEQTSHLEAIALLLLAALAGIAAVLIIGQTIARFAFFESDDSSALHGLGMSRRQLFFASILRLLLIGVAAALIAIVLAVSTSPLSPIGFVRTVEPHPGINADATTLGIGAVGVIVIVCLLGGLPSLQFSRADSVKGANGLGRRTRRQVDVIGRSSFAPPLGVGVRMALEPGRGRTAVPVRSTLFGAVIGIAALTTAFIFASSLHHLVDTPRLAGWNWNGSIGDPSDPDDASVVLKTLDRELQVGQMKEITVGGAASLSIRGTTVEVTGQNQRAGGSITPVLLEGRPPTKVDEIVLGGPTLRSIHARVGDVVKVTSGETIAYVHIVGRCVLPPIGSQDASVPGGWMTYDALHRIVPSAPRNLYLFRFPYDHIPGGIGTIAAGVSQASGHASFNLSRTEGDVADLAHMVSLPLMLASILALIAVATLTHTLLCVVRRRRRDLAVLKSLGFDNRQVRIAVGSQATTIISLSLLFGIPLGITAGRWAWNYFADRVGFVPDAVVPFSPVLLTIPIAIALSNAIAALPARAAARARPGLILRAE